jgi:hypothetical protein
MKVILVSEEGRPKRYGFKCPGCGRHHHLPVEQDGAITPWGFNWNLENPTFTPSILSSYGIVDGIHQKCCHSFVTNGQIQFLRDCFHDLKGTTVELPEIDPDNYY